MRGRGVLVPAVAACLAVSAHAQVKEIRPYTEKENPNTPVRGHAVVGVSLMPGPGDQEQDRLFRFANKIEHPKGGRFEYRGKTHRTAEAAKLLEALEAEIKADHDHLAALDRRIFLVYMGMAHQLDHGITAQELEQRYRFQLAVQEMVGTLSYWNGQVQASLHAVTATREPAPEAEVGAVELPAARPAAPVAGGAKLLTRKRPAADDVASPGPARADAEARRATFARQLMS